MKRQKLDKMKVCYMEQLPVELKLQIMGYLPGKDLARLACVSCEWQRMTPSSDSEVWKNLCHADKAWKNIRKLLHNHPKYDNNFGWSWKDLFGLWTLCGSLYYNWLLVACAEQGLHSAMKLFKMASTPISPFTVQPYHYIHPPGFIDQAPELPYFESDISLVLLQEWPNPVDFSLDPSHYHINAAP